MGEGFLEIKEVFLEIKEVSMEKGVAMGEVFLAIRKLRWEISFGSAGS